MAYTRQSGQVFAPGSPVFGTPIPGLALPGITQATPPMAVPVVMPVTAPPAPVTQVYPAPAIEPIVCPVCPSLPSSDTAYAALQGKPSAFLYVLRDLVGRSALIGLGLYAAGERDGKKLAKYAVAGGVSIELCVFGYVWATTRRK